MIRQGTDYKLAKSGHDYASCHSFLRRFDQQTPHLTFPTVMAERGNELIGVLGTKKSRKAVVAGPLYVEVPGNYAFVTLRLIEAYENILRHLGIRTFLFSIWQHQPTWVKMVTDLGCIPYENGADGKVWFKREL